MRQQINLVDLITILEMPSSSLDFLKTDWKIALSGLREFKVAVRKQRRQLAIQYHPDKENGNDKRMKEINAVADFLLTLRIERPRPQPRVIVFQGTSGFANMASGTSTATTAF